MPDLTHMSAGWPQGAMFAVLTHAGTGAGVTTGSPAPATACIWPRLECTALVADTPYRGLTS